MIARPHPFDINHPLKIRNVLAAALRTYRRRFARVSLAAIVVFVPLGILESLSHAWLEDVSESETSIVVIALVVVVVAFFATFGDVFFTGVMDEVVGSDLRDRPLPAYREIVRGLPYGRLLVADLLFALIVVVLIVFAVIPGLIGYTFFCLVGPVINIEKRGVLDGFKRSAQLVRRALGVTVLLVVIPNLLESQLDPILLFLVEHDAFWVFMLVNLTFAVVLIAALAVINVTLAHVLIARDKAALEIEAGREAESHAP